MKSLKKKQRGSALLVVVVLLVALALIGIAVVSRATTEADSAGAKRQMDKTTSCAEAARSMLVSQFRTYGANPTSITLDRTVDGKRMLTGHFDDVSVTNTVSVSSGVASGNFGATDIANTIAKTRLGGQLYRMTVVCSSPGMDGGATQQDEVEYLVRFGL